ncbi:elongation factor P isoform X3 [Carya illinoinensis]|uniref:elongation factor P isoform X3 n=1 Tax=Carya illinoinensis TaxID=32201 RepID=UPI001C729629|nr:elongation factor P isoform X3 [Carya illinoinensis]
MRPLHLSKKTKIIFSFSRALFLPTSTSCVSCRTLATLPSSPLSSTSCQADNNRRTYTWLSSPTATNILLRTPWSVSQHRGIKISGSDVKVGNVIEKKRTYVPASYAVIYHLVQVLKTDHSHEGRGKATIKVELRDIESGNKVSQRLATYESVEKVYVQQKTYMYMCTDRSGAIVLMDVETFDQLEVSQELFGKDAKYLKGDMRVTVRLYDGIPFSASVPKHVTCIVKEAQPPMMGITATPRYQYSSLPVML